MDVEVRATQVVSVWIHLLALFCPNKSIHMMGFQPLSGGPSIILSPGLSVELEPNCFVVCVPPALIWAPQQRGVCVCSLLCLLVLVYLGCAAVVINSVQSQSGLYWM